LFFFEINIRRLTDKLIFEFMVLILIYISLVTYVFHGSLNSWL